MFDRHLSQIMRLTAEMESRAATSDWQAVRELDTARMAELEKLNPGREAADSKHAELLNSLLQSNQNIVSLAREARSNLSLERERLVQGKQATSSYQNVQEGL